VCNKMEVIEFEAESEYQMLLKGSPQTCGMRAGRVFLRPGASIGEHSTEGHEELLTFLSGRGTAYIGSDRTPHEVGGGKVAYIPPHTTHDIKNTSLEPLVYVYCVAPASQPGEK
jgi:mannose-6-phosphate isomerase-like protein (cupin superfamily)